MASATGKARCVICGKEKSTLRCEGCLQTFCYNHVADHRQELSKQFDEIEVTRDLFRQTLTEQIKKPQKHSLIQQIDRWERDSTDKIRRTAEEARQLFLKHTAEHFNNIEVKLNKLTNQLRESREENDFFETDLRQWTEELTRLKEELSKPSNVTVKHNSVPLVTKIAIDISGPSRMPSVSANPRWIQNGITVAGGNGAGVALSQLNSPHGLYVDDDQTIYIAEYWNHRIVEWKCDAMSGQVVVGANGQGNRNNQLNSPTDVIVDKENDSLIISDRNNRRVVRWPRKNGTSGETIISDVDCDALTMDHDGYLYVSDFSKHEVKRWRIGDINGTIVAGGNGQGNRLDQLHGPTFVFVDEAHSVYVSDQNNNRVMKWMKGAKEGVVVAGGHGNGKSLTQLRYPSGIVVDQLGTVYVADYGNDRVMRWSKGATQGSIVVGEDEKGEGANQFNMPWALSFDQQGNLYVVDLGNHRVQKFHINPSQVHNW